MSTHTVSTEVVEELFQLIPEVRRLHHNKTRLFEFLDGVLRAYLKGRPDRRIEASPMDGILWPATGLGNVSSDDFFSMSEMIFYSFYWINRDRYRVAFDVGANAGFDSIVLGRFGYEVHSFEPDPDIFRELRDNLKANRCEHVTTHNRAVSTGPGTVTFVRVKGNLTANHISGVRDYYGEAETFPVETVSLLDLGVRPDLIKMDTEGHEHAVLTQLGPRYFETVDCILEIHDTKNRDAVFDLFEGSGVNLFSQQLGWERVEHRDQLPAHSSHGHVFVSSKPEMPW